MSNKTTYPGFSILFSIGKYRKFSIEKDEYSFKINFLWFTILMASKDLNNMLDSYLETLLDRIKELQSEKETK